MKLKCQGTELSDALTKVVKALPLKRSNPILEGVKLTAAGDTLTLFATDLELAIEKKINAEVLIEGEIVVPGKLFADYVKKIEEEELELDGTDNNRLIMKYLDSDVAIKCYGADEYPVFDEVAKESSFIVLKKDLKELINKIIINVASDEARPSLRGCCLNIDENLLEGVASDGYRLALVKAPIQNNGLATKVIVPAKSMMEISRLIDDENESMTVYVEKNYLMVDLFHTKIVTRLIAEDYINYNKLTQTSFKSEVTVDKKMFENAVDRVSVISRGDKKSFVKMEVREDVLCLSARSEDGEVNEKMTIGLKGIDMIIGFNSKYLMDCLRVINEDFITVNLSSSTSPAIIKGSDGSWLYLILPIRAI